MKKYILFATALLCTPFAICADCRPSNYIIATRYGDTAASESHAIKSITYYDGLGRQRLSVDVRAGGDENNIATRIDYDRRGNPFKEWLPIPIAISNSYVNDNSYENAAQSFYGTDEIPYTLSSYEESSNQIISYQGPGKLWQNHSDNFLYLANDSLDSPYSCQILKVTNDGTLTANGLYPNGSLRIKKQTNPDGITILEFSDRKDRVILRRQISADNSTIADTRFVFDFRNDLRYVISPEGMALIGNEGDVATEILHQFANSYTYDTWHKIIEKRIAGCEPVEYVYDRLNRPFMSRDGIQRSNGEWIMTKYDQWQRPILEGVIKSRQSRTVLQDLYGDSIVCEQFIPDTNSADYRLFYSKSHGPESFEPYRAWYYDNYDFANDYSFPDIPGYICNNNLSSKGLCTGTAEKIDGTVWFSATRYDYRGNPIWKCRYDCFLQDSRITECIEYDFRGNIIRRLEKVEDMTEGLVRSSRQAQWIYTLDASDRIISVSLAVDDCAPIIIQENEYDAIGRLSACTAGVRTEYDYDIRSNIIKIVAPQFLQQLYYACNPFNPQEVSFAGKLCTACETHRDEELFIKHEFSYGYDALGRFASAESVDGEISEYMETDLNANILHVKRKFGGDVVQDAVLEYNGNQISAIYDDSTPYHAESVASFPAGTYERSYDDNGRLIADETRSISTVSYHPWKNLPKRVTFKNGGYVNSSYLPDGTLMGRQFGSRIVETVTRVDPETGKSTTTERTRTISEVHVYRGSFEQIGSAWRLHAETGFYDLSEKCFYFYVRDRLGSTVAVVGQNGKTVQLTAYYPSGIPYDILGFDRTTDHLHIGNKWIEHDGYYSYDNAARIHFPLLPSYDAPDPKAEQYPSFSPYAHCAGDPINFIDPTGEEWLTLKDMELSTQLLETLSNVLISIQNKINQINQKEQSLIEKGKKLSKRKKLKRTRLIEEQKVAQNAIDKITAMGSSDRLFTYKEKEGEVGYTSVKDGVITMEITSFDDLANALHETIHGYGYWKIRGYGTNPYNKTLEEIEPYKAQYVIDKYSLPPSDTGKIHDIFDITRKWIIGIRTSNFIYPYTNPQCNSRKEFKQKGFN